MVIKTITCHDVYNVGASLQAYALAAYLKSLGHDVKIIDYKPDYLVHHKMGGIGNPVYNKPLLREAYLLAKLPGRIKARFSRRKREYDRFTAEYLPTTPRRYASNEELKQNPPEADLYFAGSDQIWNTLFQNGKDPAFYLDFAPKGGIKASYAASFATESIQDEWKLPVKGWLSGLDYLSVRESSGVKLIEELGISGALQVLDPVFLLDATAWETIEKEMPSQEPYLLVYDFDRSPVIAEYAKRVAKQNGWKIYSVLTCDYCDRCFDQEGPQAFLNLIHHANFVISNSFHATAFSLIFHRQFVVFSRTESINSRMVDLLDVIGLQDRYVVSGVFDAAAQEIPYKAVQEKLEKEIQKSRQYIDYVLKCVSGGD